MSPNIVAEIVGERKRQDEKWSGFPHDEYSQLDWIAFIRDHALRAFKPNQFRKQMILVAALAVAAIETYDRKEQEK